jgi:hypothetical protein
MSDPGDRPVERVDTRTDGRPVDPPSAGEVSLSRRALIQAGWTLPVVLAVRLPRDAFAEYAHGDIVHADSGSYHVDTVQHADTSHGDFNVGGHHVDVGHVDMVVHGDASV